MEDLVWKITNPLHLNCKIMKIEEFIIIKILKRKTDLFPTLNSPIVRRRNLLELIFEKLDQLKEILSSEGNGNSITVLL